MPTIIDRYNETVVFYPFRPNHPKGKTIKRKRDYNEKNPRTAKRVKTLIRFLYEKKRIGEKCIFVTITTCQHKNGFTDAECFRRIYLWLKNRKVNYVLIAERQNQNTNDIHFHIILTQFGYFDIQSEVSRIAKLFEVSEHPALFDVSKIRGIGTLRKYITKYFTKRPKKPELFKCRTWSSTLDLRRRYKKFALSNVVRCSDDFILANYSHFTHKKVLNEYCVLYKFTISLFKRAAEFRRLFEVCEFTKLNL
jgi:hypothetical protein